MICPKCETVMILQDDSFDHAFGVEIIKYMICPKCEHTEDNWSDEDET